MRAVRATHRDLVVIDTDAGVVRELPAGYVAEHVEHAYCLTGHGMQGGTVEHATVLARPRELFQGWSYTALSRARGATRLHIDGRDVAAATVAERAELAPHEHQPRPDREQVLARVAARMRVRDDEDLAVTQLPVRSAPGRADDPQLRDTASVPAAAPPEHAAERAEPRAAPAPEHARLAAIRAEADRLTTQLAGLPMRELRQLDQIAAERAQVATQRDDAATRLHTLPAPEHMLLDRTRDPHAAERARLAAAVGAADQQLAALDQHAARLEHDAGRGPCARSATASSAASPSSAPSAASCVTRSPSATSPGRRRGRASCSASGPAHPRQAEQYDRGIREVARYRVEHDVVDETRALGQSPTTSTLARPGDRQTRPWNGSNGGSA